MSNNRSGFKLTIPDVHFMERQKKVFDQLKVLENNRRNTGSDEQEMEVDGQPRRVRNQRSVTRHFRGKESIFKKPQNPVPKNYINKIPDFKKNPHKWTKYSLEDVEEITEESNTRSALSFLKELADRKKIETGVQDEEKSTEVPMKIIFNKHISKNINLQEEKLVEDKITFTNSKVVMPEYVIGQKFKKNKRNIGVKAEKGKELRLDHLFNQGEDE